MASSSDNAIFLDTNVLIYANVASAPWHQIAIATLQELSDNGTLLWISRQVLREFIATLTRPQTFNMPQPIEVVIKRTRFLQETFLIADDDALVTAKLLELLEQIPIGGRQIHDANIVATMLTTGIPNLLTHNVKDFTRFNSLINITPLVTNDLP